MFARLLEFVRIACVVAPEYLKAAQAMVYVLPVRHPPDRELNPPD